MMLRARNVWLILLVTQTAVHAADMRARVRVSRPEGTTVSESQATDLTLTLTETTVRPIQSWVRASGNIDRDAKLLTAYVAATDSGYIRVGQRARAFSADSKASMYQARITRIVPQGDRSLIEATLSGTGFDADARYLLEVVIERGEFLSVPNEAIIEEGDKQVVYVQDAGGGYHPRTIDTGLQGERYTQVLKGVEPGEQVVTTGSFFIDAEYKMKGGN
jgi:multidrug efflux pump subunit AcrA (membrane-fusion protein)